MTDTAAFEKVEDQFAEWRESIATGKPVDTKRGFPRSGYYRLKGEAIAFWRQDGSDDVLCWRSGGKFTPRDHDETDELFGWCAPHPVSYENYQFFVENGRWPDEIEPVNISADLAPHEAAAAELVALREQAKTWLDGIGKVQTQSDADKCGSFADAFAKAEKRATDLHREEKAPHLEAGRAVDAAWKPIIEKAGVCKSWAKKAAEAFLIAERARLAEEEKACVEESARIARENERARVEAERAGAPPPIVEAPAPPPPPQVKAKAGTAGRGVSIRTRTVHRIVDVRSLLMFLADMNEPNPDLMATLQILVNRMRSAGVSVPGVETRTVEEAA